MEIGPSEINLIFSQLFCNGCGQTPRWVREAKYEKIRTIGSWCGEKIEIAPRLIKIICPCEEFIQTVDSLTVGTDATKQDWFIYSCIEKWKARARYKRKFQIERLFGRQICSQ